jgi:hypothetical protein
MDYAVLAGVAAEVGLGFTELAKELRKIRKQREKEKQAAFAEQTVDNDDAD